mmetsp:Transcript_24800/g.78394  ORF Transcript_24800/g.78394 Transcript_24800/m.78394 type:complete len:818 (-) Transcript_24800:625-3078(-)
MRMRLVAALAIVFVVAGVSNAQTTCDGDFVVSSAGHWVFDGLWSPTGNSANGKPVYSRNNQYFMWFSVYGSPQGVTGNGIAAWVLHTTTAADNGQYYAWAVNQEATAHPFDVPQAQWQNYLSGCTIQCVNPVSPEPEETPAPVEAPSPPAPYAFPSSHTTCMGEGFKATGVISNTAWKCRNWCECSGSTCSYCCKKEGRYCLRELPVTLPSEATGFGRKCDPRFCAASDVGDGKCNGGCNNPDCGFDGGDCCTSPASYGFLSTHPLHCQDPTSAQFDAENNFRLEYGKGACRKEPRNQGTCGACYAFALTTAATHSMCLADDPGSLIPLSPRYIDTCFSGCQKGHLSGRPATCSSQPVSPCSGGALTEVAKELTAPGRGAPTEACYPYSEEPASQCSDAALRAPSSSCSSAGKDYLATAASETAKGRWVIELKPGNFALVKKVLRNVGPIAMGMELTEGFMNLYDASKGFEWSSDLSHPRGLFNSSYGGRNFQANTGGHAMVITGFGQFTDQYRTRNYYVVENSWGFAPNHDLGYVYLDAEEDWWVSHVAYAVVPGHLSEDAEAAMEWCTARGGCKDLRRRAARRMLADDIVVIPQENSRVEVDEYRGMGEVAATECTRPNVANAIDKGLAEVQKVFGSGVEVKMEELKSCSSQAVAGEVIYLRFAVKVGGSFEKDVEINITHAPGGVECDPGDGSEDGAAADECDGKGFNLGDWKITGTFVGDNGLDKSTPFADVIAQLAAAAAPPPDDLTPAPVAVPVPAAPVAGDWSGGLSFWGVVGAGGGGGLLCLLRAPAGRLELALLQQPVVLPPGLVHLC